MIIKIDLNMLGRQIDIIDNYADDIKSEEDKELIYGATELLSQLHYAVEHGDEVIFCAENYGYTAFLYETNSEYILDEYAFRYKDEAIRFMYKRKWDEVVDNTTGEVIKNERKRRV